MLAGYNIYFADLHFHTNYSDNRDRATIEDMIIKGSRHGITVFGTADHNHNLDIIKWKTQAEETKKLQSKYPNFLIMNNCEITFLLGHFVVINPQIIMGTIEEGYRFLYTQRNIIKILAHPNPGTDEWHTRIVPFIKGIEVVNGSVFRKAVKSGYKFRTALDIPMLHSYSEYIAMGYPVAAIGNSDAHELSEIGSGMTGLYLPAKPEKSDLLYAIANQKTFATTDQGIHLKCSMDNARHEFNWQISWDPEITDRTDKYTVEVYNRSDRVAVTENSGKIKATEDGTYWAVVFNRENIAVSSPLCYKKTETKNYSFMRLNYENKREKHAVEKRFKNTLKDIYWLELRKKTSFNFSPVKKSVKAEIEIYSPTREPLITDALGNKINFRLSSPAKYRTIINKQCKNPCFDEFYIWLKRNEIHEYMFFNIDYKNNGDLFILNALLVPAKMVFIDNFGKKYRDISASIKKLVSSKTLYKLTVKTLYKLSIQLDFDSYYFPFEINKNRSEIHNYLFWINHNYSTAYKIPKSTRQAWENIFQIFM